METKRNFVWLRPQWNEMQNSGLIGIQSTKIIEIDWLREKWKHNNNFASIALRWIMCIMFRLWYTTWTNGEKENEKHTLKHTRNSDNSDMRASYLESLFNAHQFEQRKESKLFSFILFQFINNNRNDNNNSHKHSNNNQLNDSQSWNAKTKQINPNSELSSMLWCKLTTPCPFANVYNLTGIAERR